MSRRAWVVVGVVAAAALVAALVAGMAASSHRDAHTNIVLAKKAGGEAVKDLAGVANEGPESTWEAEQAAARAYPADAIPSAAQSNSASTFKALNNKGGKKGAWQSIGPQAAEYPAVLDQFLAGGKPYTASGRVTALAIGGCKPNNKCSLYVGAAGGGVWVGQANDGADGHWKFVSGSFGTNAIGALLVDPADPSGNTVYAGTGEPNASADSEAGLGIYKSTDGGDTWSFVPGSDTFRDRAIGALAFDKDHNLLVGLASAIRGISSVSSGGAIGCNTPTTPPGCNVRGLYRQTGATFTRIFTSAVAGVATRGVTDVELDPWNPSTIYLASFQQGVWRSLDNGATWTQIKTALNAAQNTDRAQFSLGKLPGGFTRMYVGIGNAGTNAARFYRTDDAAGAAVFTDMTTPQTLGYCTGQCWYDNVVYSPSEDPNVVYLGGSFSYGEQNVIDNGRAVVMSTDGGVTFTDMTRDKGDDGWLHPDQHALVTMPGKPLQWIAGDDGGVVRSDGKYVDGSGHCADYGATGAALAYCQSILSRIPNQTTVLNKGLVTLQFQSLSINPKDPKGGLMGGTQDNGTFEYTGGSGHNWPQIIYGDGGQSGWSASDSKLRFNTFTGQASDTNFQNGDPTKWVIATGPIVASADGAYFYPPIIADPNPAAGGTIFQGSFHIWRTQDWGGNQAFLEANCPEFTTSAANPTCGDFAILGGTTAGANTAGSLIGTAYGADRTGGDVAAIERAPSNTGTLWAATGTGRLFISDNADAPAASVTFTRLDTSAANDPNRFISSIYVDPTNPNRAWVSYSGYNINTPAQPGHVFRVDRIGGVATWTDITFDLQDLPITDLVRDDATGDLYAASDFGVMRLANGATSWTMAADGMPMVEVPGLSISSDARILYAATHGLGAWKLELPKVEKH